MTDEITTVDPQTATEDDALWAKVTAAVSGGKPQAEPQEPKTTGRKEGEAPASPDTSGSPPAPEAADIWATATEEQRKAFEELNHRAKSDGGRVSALQRQINDLQKQIQDAAKAAPAAQNPAIDWAAFEKDYPDEANALKALQAESDTKIQALQQKLDSLSGTSESQFFDLLDAMRPAWRDTVNTPEFGKWLAAQDEVTQAQFQSSRVSDAVGLLRAYDQHQDAAKAKAASLKQERAKRAESSTSAIGRSSAPALDSPGDADADWASAVASAEKRIGRRR